jgi:hypothetical protein
MKRPSLAGGKPAADPNLSVEQEVKRFLSGERLRFDDNTASYHQPDFTVYFSGDLIFYLEVKEKRQPYNMRNWPAFAPEADLFILDDLTVRKCLAYSPGAGVLVRNNLQRSYRFFSVVDLALMPKLRVNRAIERETQDVKGKWLINLQNGWEANTIEESFWCIQHYLRDLPAILFDHHPCYGDFVGEEISGGGVVRQPAHWDSDVASTR